MEVGCRMAPRSQQEKWVDRGWYLVTELGHSTAQQYEAAVELARSLPNYMELLDENRRVLHRNTFARREVVPGLWTLLEMIGLWQSSRTYVRGHEVAPYDVLSKCACFRRRTDFRECDPEVGTMPLFFGCPNSRIGLWPTAREPWFTRGQFDGRLFTVPKGRLLGELRRSLEWCDLCPNLDLRAAEVLLKRLPDTVDPAADRRWHVKPSQWGAASPALEPASLGEYYNFIAEHLYSAPRGEPSA
jgi:hypothetical protein